MSKPILWVSLTSNVNGENERAVDAVREQLTETFGDEYDVVLATDKVRLMDARDVCDLLGEALGVDGAVLWATVQAERDDEADATAGADS